MLHAEATMDSGYCNENSGSGVGLSKPYDYRTRGRPVSGTAHGYPAGDPATQPFRRGSHRAD